MLSLLIILLMNINFEDSATLIDHLLLIRLHS